MNNIKITNLTFQGSIAINKKALNNSRFEEELYIWKLKK